MRGSHIRKSSTRCASPVSTSTATPAKAEQKTALPNVIHLGIDVHLRQHVVCRKIDATSVPPAQRMKPEQFVAWAEKQMAPAHRMVCCCEAGPFGYTLQR